MTNWLLKRLLLCVPTLLGISLVTFAISRLVPGGPLAELMEVSGGHQLTQEQLANTQKLLGLDRPLPEQYLDWLSRSLRFDFGRSLLPDRRPVVEKVGEAFRVSFLLQLVAVVLVYATAIPLGVWSAAHAGTRWERALGTMLFLWHSMPVLLVGTLLILLFCTGRLGRLPMMGLRSPGSEALAPWEAFVDLARHALLPVICLWESMVPAVTRFARAGMFDVLAQPWIVAARSRGLSERRILYRHALRVGILPLVTLLGNLVPWLVAGSIIVESLFGIPGMGLLATTSILASDYPTVMAVSVLVGVATMAGFLLTDVLYVLLQRRIRLE